MTMKILYEDKNQIAVYKPAGIATQTARLGEKDLVSEVKNHICKTEKKSNPYIGVINRLDQPVEGIVLFAKNAKTASDLSMQMQGGIMSKFYYAAVYGHMEDNKDILTDYLEKDGRTNTSKVVLDKTKDAKKAVLQYEVKAGKDGIQLVEIELMTGRHHQIRVQFSHRGHPLIGDTKYGTEESMSIAKNNGIRVPALCAYKLIWNHPITKEKIDVVVEPEHSLLKELCLNRQEG